MRYIYFKVYVICIFISLGWEEINVLDGLDWLSGTGVSTALEKSPGLLALAYMGQFPQDGENGQNVAFFLFFGALLWPNCLIFSFSFVLVLAHLEPKLELFEVDDIGDDCDDEL